MNEKMLVLKIVSVINSMIQLKLKIFILIIFYWMKNHDLWGFAQKCYWCKSHCALCSMK